VKTKIYNADTKKKEQLYRQLADILQTRTDIVFAYLYGSFVDDLPFHDIDVAVYFADAREAAITLDTLDLSDRLSKELSIPVDVRPLNFASIPFRYQVIRGQLLFEKDQDRTAQFIEQTVQRYLDIKPFLLTGMKEAFAA
jgi:hypothetical protein